MRRNLARAGLVLLGALSCSDQELGPNISGVDGSAIVEVRVQPSIDTIFIPDTVRSTDRLQLQGIAIGRLGQAIQIGRFVWRSSDPTVAVVDSLGLVTPVRMGTVEITASAYRVGASRIVVRPAASQIVVTPRADTIYVDEPATSTTDSIRFEAQAYDGDGAALDGVRYVWQSSSVATATVDSTGLVKALSFGATTLTVSGNGVSATAEVLARPRSALSHSTATVPALPIATRAARWIPAATSHSP